jgi:hypothetical protein
VIRRDRSGETLVEVTAKTGVSKRTVERRLMAAGILLRPAGWTRGKRRAVEEFLRRPEARGITQQQVAVACGVTQSYISRVAKRMGAAHYGT